MRCEVVPLENEHLDRAAEVVAREQRATIGACPGLALSYLDPAYCRDRLTDLAHSHLGRVAISGSQVLGVLHGSAEDGWGDLPAQGCAIEPAVEDVTAVLGALLADVAPRFVAQAALRHGLSHVAHPRLAEAAADLLFGRSGRYAALKIDPRAARLRPQGLEIRQATADDLDSIAELSLVEIAQRVLPPLYAPPSTQTHDEVKDERAAGLARGQLHLIARSQSRDVGLLAAEPSAEHHRLMRAGSLYLGPVAVRPEARGSGVASALVDAALQWGTLHGFTWASVAFATANLLSRPFWHGAGFATTGHVQLRTVNAAFAPRP